jgi:hypothetical protein
MGGQGLVNGRKLFILFGLLRNSTKIAAQFSGLGQSSQKAPEKDEKLKRGPIVHQPLSTHLPSYRACDAGLNGCH